MDKLRWMILLLVLVLGVTGCSKPQEESVAIDPAPTAQAEATPQPAQTQAPQPEGTAQPAGVQAGEGTVPEAVPDLSDWVCYTGTMEDGAVVYLAFDSTATKGVFMALYDQAGQSVLISGDYSYNEATGVETIQDGADGPAIQFVNTPVANGVFALQLGQQGQVQVTEVDAAQAMECAQRIQAGTQDVTADFLTKLA